MSDSSGVLLFGQFEGVGQERPDDCSKLPPSPYPSEATFVQPGEGPVDNMETKDSKQEEQRCREAASVGAKSTQAAAPAGRPREMNPVVPESLLPHRTRAMLGGPPPPPSPMAAHDYSSSSFSPPETAEEWEKLQMLRGYQDY
ncbi:unnamed protein product [Amoebophrya sp. A120]|nr:unnamed protein product [Amoebophrya sp. A120]|eukprot:GSA120T00014646001.1